MLASAICVIVVIVQSFIDLSSDGRVTPPHSGIGKGLEFFTGFATITFAFGGNAVYPHVEESLEKPEKFGRALTISMILVSCMYLPVAIVGYAVYGNDVASPVLISLPDNWATDLASMVITAHVVLAYPIPMTAVVLEFEPIVDRLGAYVHDRLNLQSGSTHAVEWTARALFRTTMVVMTMILAAYVPYFDLFMELLGAVCNCALVFVRFGDERSNNACVGGVRRILKTLENPRCDGVCVGLHPGPAGHLLLAPVRLQEPVGAGAHRGRPHRRRGPDRGRRRRLRRHRGPDQRVRRELMMISCRTRTKGMQWNDVPFCILNYMFA